MQVEELKEKAADLTDHVEDLANTFYRLTVVNITQKATNIASGAITMLTVCVLGFIVLLFLGVALSLWLGNILENPVAGFLLGAASFLVILLSWRCLERR
ncbi:MAG: phage holin family protein [Chitinophagaceae bacterium]